MRKAHLSQEGLETKPEPVSVFGDFHRRRKRRSCFLREGRAGLLHRHADSSPDAGAETNQRGFYSNSSLAANARQTHKKQDVVRGRSLRSQRSKTVTRFSYIFRTREFMLLCGLLVTTSTCHKYVHPLTITQETHHVVPDAKLEAQNGMKYLLACSARGQCRLGRCLHTQSHSNI